MKDREIMSKLNSGLLVVSTSAVIVTLCSIYLKRKTDCHAMQPVVLKEQKEICPTCGLKRVEQKSLKCEYCESVCQRCGSCGKLYHSLARFCPYCGKKNETGGWNYVEETNYKEPFPRDYVTLAVCSCGTPFAVMAKYCQCCGNSRPMILDEFVNVGTIPDFDTRKRKEVTVLYEKGKNEGCENRY